MRKYFFYIFIFISTNCFSQLLLEKMPEGTKEILFVYETKSNILVNNNEVNADASLLLFEFPDLSKIIDESKVDSLTNITSISLSNFSMEQKKVLASIIYHTNETHECVYNVDKQTITINSSRNDNDTKLLLKNILNQNYLYFNYKSKINFEKKTMNVNFPKVSYKHTFEEIEKNIVQENELLGSFVSNKLNNSFKLDYKTFVKLNHNLDKHVIPFLLKNNLFGVEITQDIYETTALKTITYR